jgi:hypothetical protein
MSDENKNKPHLKLVRDTNHTENRTAQTESRTNQAENRTTQTGGNTPDYRTPAKMLRNLAEEIEVGRYGDISTVVVALSTDRSVAIFGGGKNSDLYTCSHLFGHAHYQLITGFQEG